jgi:hypothetical protein
LISHIIAGELGTERVPMTELHLITHAPGHISFTGLRYEDLGSGTLQSGTEHL